MNTDNKQQQSILSMKEWLRTDNLPASSNSLEDSPCLSLALQKMLDRQESDKLTTNSQPAEPLEGHEAPVEPSAPSPTPSEMSPEVRPEFKIALEKARIHALKPTTFEQERATMDRFFKKHPL